MTRTLPERLEALAELAEGTGPRHPLYGCGPRGRRRDRRAVRRGLRLRGRGPGHRNPRALLLHRVGLPENDAARDRRLRRVTSHRLGLGLPGSPHAGRRRLRRAGGRAAVPVPHPPWLRHGRPDRDPSRPLDPSRTCRATSRSDRRPASCARPFAGASASGRHPHGSGGGIALAVTGRAYASARRRTGAEDSSALASGRAGRGARPSHSCEGARATRRARWTKQARPDSRSQSSR